MPRHGQRCRRLRSNVRRKSGRIEAFESLKAGRWRIRSARLSLANITRELGWLQARERLRFPGEAAPIRQPDGFVEKAIWRFLDSVTYSWTNFPAAGGRDTVIKSI